MVNPNSRPWAVTAGVLLVLAIVAWLAYSAGERGLFNRQEHRLIVEKPDPALERAKGDRQVAQEILAELMPVIADARKLTESLRDPEGPFTQTLKSGQLAASKVYEIAEKTGQVFDQTQQTVKTIETNATATLQKAGRTIEIVEQAAPSVIEKVQQAAVTSQKTSADLQAMAAQASERLPVVLDQVQAAATQTNQMVSAARQTWPISVLTGTSTTPQSLPIDSIGGLPLPGEAP